MSVARQAIYQTTPRLPHCVVFRVSEARRALPYISRAVADIQQAYKTANRCRTALKRRLTSEEKCSFEQFRDNALMQLNRAIDECDAVGANVVNMASGTVKFEAKTQGRFVSLVWRLGEPTNNVWPDIAD